MALLQKFKFPIFVTLLLTLAVVLADPKLREAGGPIILLVYAVMMAVIIYRNKNGHTVSK